MAGRAVLAWAAIGLLGGCADEPTAECASLRYDAVAEPFVASWCRGCHSAALPPQERQRAPIDVTFENHDELVRWAPRLRVRVVDTETMPPAGGPGAQERALFARYLACGAPP
jgi:uncharacterized membrane protein